MSDDEIVISYRQAKDKEKQITILRQLNDYISNNSIINILVKYGEMDAPPPSTRRKCSKKPKPHPRLAEMQRLQEQGYNFSKIARKTGLSWNVVNYNLNIKPQKEAIENATKTTPQTSTKTAATSLRLLRKIDPVCHL